MSDERIAEIRDYVRIGQERWHGDQVESVVCIIAELCDDNAVLRARLAEVETRVGELSFDLATANDDILTMSAQLAEATPIIAAVANECTVAMSPAINGMSFGEDKHESWCAACLCVQVDGKEIHDDDCPTVQARAYQAKYGATDTEVE